jgi:hypothetical protein
MSACIAFALLSGEASATKITAKQVIAICGDKLQSGGTGGTHASGCEQKCGNKICTFNCCSGPNCGEEGCHGHTVEKRPLPSGLANQLKGTSHPRKHH